MHEALNKRLAALPDDTVVYVGRLVWKYAGDNRTDFPSLVMSIQNQTLSLPIPYLRPMRSRNCTTLRRTIKKRLVNSPSETRRNTICF